MLEEQISKNRSVHTGAALWLMFCMVPLWTGCFTRNTLDAASRPTSRSLYDRIDSIDKAILKEDTLLLFLEGQLTNFASKSKFTVAVPLASARSTNAEVYSKVGRFPPYARLKVSRDAIHPSWALETHMGDAFTVVPVGPPQKQDAYPDDFPWERPVVYSEFAKPLPGTSRTIYPLILYDDRGAKADPKLAMEFVFVDSSVGQAYSVIYVEQVKLTEASQPEYYGLLPIAILADIVTFPIQAFAYVFFYRGM